jgi:AraC family transcriptional regulator, transcriptional activator of pobA
MTIIPIHNLQVKNLKRENFDIIQLNGEQDKDYDSVIPHRHNFYELMVFDEGDGKHEIDFNEYPIEKNSVHFVSPTQVHRLKSAAAKGHVICFSEEFITLEARSSFLELFPYYDFHCYSPTIKLCTETFNDLRKSLDVLKENFSKDSFLKDDIVRCHLQIILLKIKEFFLINDLRTTHQISSTNSKILQFKKLIDVNYIKHFSAFQYAQNLNISPNYLNSICKKETGKTATELVHERLLLESKRLLYSTRLSIKEISGHLNFDSDAYFVRFFKKEVGKTPLDFRNSFSQS